MRRTKSFWGGALTSTFLVAILLILLGLTLVNLATLDLRSVNRSEQKEKAFRAAEAGLNHVVAQLSVDPRVGDGSESFEATLGDGSSYTVTFDDSVGSAYSVNNLAGFTGRPGYNGRVVPPFHALLFAEGTSPSGAVSLVECLIRLEALPYAVAGTGGVDLNSMIVAGSEFPGTTLPGDPLEGHVYADRPLAVNGATQITGDARSAGAITVEPLANVAGDTEPNSDPESLPDLRISDFRNDGSPAVTVQVGGVVAAPLLVGQVYFDSDTTLTGLVTLTDATVYVNGDLTINGLLVGTGTVFVDGETRFLQSVNLTGSNRITLFSQEDVSFLLPSVFQGVIYSHGDVFAPIALLVSGAVYAVNETDATKGNVSLGPGSLVLHVRDLTEFANYYLGLGGHAKPVRVYWNRLR